MHIGKKLYRSVAVLCVLVLSFGLVFSDCMVAQAEESTNEISYSDIDTTRLLDVALNQQGVYVKRGLIESEIESALKYDIMQANQIFYNTMGSLQSEGYITREQFDNYISSLEAHHRKWFDYCLRDVKESLYMGDIMNLLTITDEKLNAVILKEAEHGGGGLRRGQTYTLDEDYVNSAFDKFGVWFSENRDYITMYTKPVTAIIDDFAFADNKLYIANAVSYLIDTFDINVGVSFESSNGLGGGHFVILPKDSEYWGYSDLLDTNDALNSTECVVVRYEYPYTATTVNRVQALFLADSISADDGIYKEASLYNCNLTSFVDSAKEYGSSELWNDIRSTVNSSSVVARYFYELRSGGGSYSYSYVYGNGSNRIDINKYDSSNIAPGDTSPSNPLHYEEPFYFDDTYNPVGNINVVNVTGDYIINNNDNSSNMSYETINNNIINSGEMYIDNSVTDKIINNNADTIIFNQTGEEPEPEETATPVPTATPEPTATPVSTVTPVPTATPEPVTTPEPLVTMPPDLGDTDKDGDGEVSLTEFFQGIKDLIAWLLNTLGQIASLIADLGNGILSILNTFTGLFSGFSGLLGVMFSFIPEQLLDALTAGMSAVVLIALYNKFLGGKN